MATRLNSPGSVLPLLSKMVGGLTNKPPGGATSMVVDGQPMAMSAVVTELQGYEGIYQTEKDAETALVAARQARRKAQPTARARIGLIIKALKGMMGPHNAALEGLGITPDKVPAPLPADKQVLKAERNKATRTARGTKGKKQKAAIKGQVPAPATAAPTTPAKPGT